jgi:hypothetical protein
MTRGELTADGDPFPVVAGLQPRPIDLSVGSDVLPEGAWKNPRRLAEAVGAARATIGRWGEVRLTAAGSPASATRRSGPSTAAGSTSAWIWSLTANPRVRTGHGREPCANGCAGWA